MKLTFREFNLQMAARWTIASRLGPGGGGGADRCGVVFLELTDADGVTGLGEAAPSNRYEEDVASSIGFLQRVDPTRLSFTDIEDSMAYLDELSAGDYAPKCALEIALHDGAARRAGKPLHQFLGLGFTEGRHVTSFSIGIDQPERVREKVIAAAPYPVLKLKVGSPQDKENLAVLREVAPGKKVRADANEAWSTREEALKRIEWLASQGDVEFIEQPMPARTDPRDLIWLKSRSPIPIMADEACRSAQDIPHCAECYHSINVKLVKTGGLLSGLKALQAARSVGLRTMLGCMIESSILISAAAHLAELTDYLDLDGNLLVTNDPYNGVQTDHGILSFAKAPAHQGLCVVKRT